MATTRQLLADGDDLNRRIEALEQRVRRLETARPVKAAARPVEKN